MSTTHVLLYQVFAMVRTQPQDWMRNLSVDLLLCPAYRCGTSGRWRSRTQRTFITLMGGRTMSDSDERLRMMIGRKRKAGLHCIAAQRWICCS